MLSNGSRKRPREKGAGEGGRVIKRRRDYSSGDVELAKIYDALASERAETRLEAATKLLTHVKDEADVDRIYVRLVRGLCSSRKAARPGFFVALTELLRSKLGRGTAAATAQGDGATSAAAFLALLKQTTDPGLAAPGQEKRDFQIGRVIACDALIKSTALIAQEDAPMLDVFELLCMASKATPWLRGECTAALCDLLGSLDKEDTDRAGQLLWSLAKLNMVKTPEGVAFWLEAKTRFDHIEFPKQQWHREDPLSAKSIPKLAQAMLYGSAESSNGESKSQTGARQVNPHPAWDVVLRNLLEKDRSRSWETKVQHFQEKWEALVDQPFFAASASPEKKSLGLQIYGKLIASGPFWALAPAWSPNLKRCVANQTSQPTRFLHQAAKTVLSSLLSRSRESTEDALAVFDTLVGSSPSSSREQLNFDKTTGTKTVANLLLTADKGVCATFVSEYTKISHVPAGDTPEEEEQMRQLIADQLLHLVRNRPLDKQDRLWLLGVVQLFATGGYSKGLGIDDLKAASGKTRDMYRARLASVLAHVLSVKAEDHLDLPTLALNSICSENGLGDSLAEADYQVKETVQKCYQILLAINAELGSKKEKDTGLGNENAVDVSSEHAKKLSVRHSTLRAFNLLFSMSLIQAHNVDADAVEVLNELADCYQGLVSSTGESQEVFDMVVEIVLSFSAKPSALYRKLSELVFTVFAEKVSASSLESMMAVLLQKENASGQQTLFEAKNEGEGLDAELDSASEIDATGSDDDDVEEVEQYSAGETGGEEKDDDEEEAEEDEDGDGDEGSSENEELAAFDKLLGSVLKTSRPKQTNGTITSSPSPSVSASDDESMDDEQMMALEPSLTAIFRDRAAAASKSGSASTRNKQIHRSAKENMINFKNRVLDLLLIYVKAQHASALAVRIVQPLLQLIRTTSSKQVAEKAFGVLNRYFDTAKSKGMPDCGSDQELDLQERIRKTHEEALMFASKVHASACSRSSLFLARCFVASEPGTAIHKLIVLYGETQKEAIATDSKLPATFWTEWINWSLSFKTK